MPSPAGWREVPCVECGAFVPGIDFGERCPACFARRVARVHRLARRTSLVATAGVAAWIVASHAVAGLGPWYAMIAIGGTYGLVFVIVKRIALEVL